MKRKRYTTHDILVSADEAVEELSQEEVDQHLAKTEFRSLIVQSLFLMMIFIYIIALEMDYNIEIYIGLFIFICIVFSIFQSYWIFKLNVLPVVFSSDGPPIKDIKAFRKFILKRSKFWNIDQYFKGKAIAVIYGDISFHDIFLSAYVLGNLLGWAFLATIPQFIILLFP
jgi:hypothetical protein